MYLHKVSLDLKDFLENSKNIYKTFLEFFKYLKSL